MTVLRMEDNLSPYLTMVETAEPTAPAAGQQRLYVDPSTHVLMIVDSTGTQVPVAGSSVTRASLGLDTTDSPQFTGINLGHASDTTLTRVSAGVVAIEGTNVVKAGAATGSGLTMATARLLGRTTASTGAIEEITVGSGLSLSGGSLTASGGGGSGNLWTMNKSSSQTLTSSTDTLITFDTTVIDGGSSTIDLANDWFNAPATGFYMAYATWLWEATAPDTSAVAICCYVNGSDRGSRCRIQASSPAVNGGANANFALSLTANDHVTLRINPGATTPTARGNASANLATSFTLLRVT